MFLSGASVVRGILRSKSSMRRPNFVATTCCAMVFLAMNSPSGKCASGNVNYTFVKSDSNETSNACADREAIGLNNAGVKALNHQDYKLATVKFLAALDLDPAYQLALNNLAITYNNLGLSLRDTDHNGALFYFHQALFLNPRNSTTSQNLSGIVRWMGKDPDVFETHVKFAEQAYVTADFVSALIECMEALRLKSDPEIEKRMHECEQKLSDSQKLHYEKTFHNQQPVLAPPSPQITATEEVDFKPYLADMSRRIERAWFPPKSGEWSQVIVYFKIHKPGGLSSLRVQESSGSIIADKAALEAVTKAAPFRPLPEGSDKAVDIAFTFDHNSWKAWAAKASRYDMLPEEIRNRLIDLYDLSPSALIEWVETQMRQFH
jgi:TonB family protein